MTQIAAAKPEPGTDEAVTTSAERWEALFGCAAPQRLPSLVEQAIAWREQALAHGDVSPAIAHDLRLAVEHALQQRGALLDPLPASGDMTNTVEQTPSAPAAPGPAASEMQVPAVTIVSAAAPVPANINSVTPQVRRGRAPPLPPAASQLLPGSQLVKAYGGRNHVVAVREDGFVYEGEQFSSLSAVAKHITGTHWNGLLFFGLRKRRTYPPRPRARGQAAAHG